MSFEAESRYEPEEFISSEVTSYRHVQTKGRGNIRTTHSTHERESSYAQVGSESFDAQPRDDVPYLDRIVLRSAYDEIWQNGALQLSFFFFGGDDSDGG